MGPGRRRASLGRHAVPAGGGIDEILKGMFGGRRGAQFEPEDFAEPPASGRDVTGSVTITLPEAAKGTSRRVLLPTGKEIDVKIPAGLADGQTIRLKGQGMPGPRGGAGDALITRVDRAASAVRARRRRPAARPAGDAL